MMDILVEHLPQHGRFQARVDGLLCVADYRLQPGVMVMTHTAVPRSLEGRGIAAALVAAALEHAHGNGLKVRPLCSYVQTYMRRHPEMNALRA
jgi:uncharacterized protein